MNSRGLIEHTLAIAQQVRAQNVASERTEIQRRVASFRANQERLRLERENYYQSVWAKVAPSSHEEMKPKAGLAPRP